MAPETNIARIGKVRLRNGVKASRTIILKPGKHEKLSVKSFIPGHAALTSEDVVISHTVLLTKSFGDVIQVDRGPEAVADLYRLEPPHLIFAAGRRLAHYIEVLIFNPIFFILGLILTVFIVGGFIRFLAAVVRGGRSAWGAIAERASLSPVPDVLLAIVILGAIVVAVGFLLAIGWRLSSRLFGRKK